ncbi:MAG: UDP-N-acetylmuramoyl-L-alanine--D-glutamate ligase [Bacillota bacterium]|nr:UDP-N-acetylmuramoyl-L-alanine--D-glutamate ligase [Bacillota bacterium]
MNFRGQRLLIVGAGKSGVAAARYALAHGAQVTLFDSKEREALPREVGELQRFGAQLYCGHALPQRVDWQLCVVSPGVPPRIPILNMTREAKVEIISEMELAYRAARHPFVAVTGTNGKTTVTSLIAYICERAGIKHLLGGNIGTPLIGAVERFNGSVIVAELSSFQLEGCSSFKPHIAVYLNLTPDHLDRHGDFAGYMAAKERVFAQQAADDYTVLNYDDEHTRAAAAKSAARIIWFSCSEQAGDGVYLRDGQVTYRFDGKQGILLPASGIYIKGRHNLQNAMAAAAAALCLGVEPERLAPALAEFRGVEHRLEFVLERDGVTYVNDSKGTNPDSTTQALLAYEQPLILLAGGRGKGADFRPLMRLIAQKCKLLIIYGECWRDLKDAADDCGYAAYQLAEGFEQAVRMAQHSAVAGDVVLLSPACASWDMFSDYEERGRVFKKLVSE